MRVRVHASDARHLAVVSTPPTCLAHAELSRILVLHIVASARTEDKCLFLSRGRLVPRTDARSASHTDRKLSSRSSANASRSFQKEARDPARFMRGPCLFSWHDALDVTFVKRHHSELSAYADGANMTERGVERSTSGDTFWEGCLTAQVNSVHGSTILRSIISNEHLLDHSKKWPIEKRGSRVEGRSSRGASHRTQARSTESLAESALHFMPLVATQATH